MPMRTMMGGMYMKIRQNKAAAVVVAIFVLAFIAVCVLAGP